MTLRVGSLFSGVGGFDLGFEQAGYTVAWQCEADDKARRVLRHRWPDVPCYDDVRTVGAHNLTPVDVLVGGFPCQDLSVAGQRKGLTGVRSGLFHDFTRIAAELRPGWVLLENVPGLLSSHRGRDFAVVVEALVNGGYGVAWRILDSRHFGVAQRRRRVFLVGCLGGGAERAAAVLFEPTRGSRNPAAGGEAGPRIAATLRGRSHSLGVNVPGRGGEDDANLVTAFNCKATDLTPGAIAPTLRVNGGTSGGSAVAFDWQSGGKVWHNVGDKTSALTGHQVPAVFSALSASLGHHGHSSPRGDGSDNLVAATLNSGGFRTEPGEHLVARCLTGTMHKRHDEDTDTLVPQHGVRRLTPRECERLQGFPDGWSCLCPAQGDTATCVCPDSPRYKQMGNAVTVPVIAWIARRLAAVAAAEEVA